MPKVYIFDDDKRKIIEMDREDVRLVFGWRNAPTNKVVVFKFRDHAPLVERAEWAYRSRPRAKDKWNYRYWGATREELCARVNAETERCIESIDTEIAKLRERADAYRARTIAP